MSTVISQVVGAIVTALGTATPVSASIYRTRLRPIADDKADAVVVRPVGAQIERFAINGAPMNLQTTIAVECYARAGTATAPDVAVDALLAAVYAKLQADTTLGGLVMDLFINRVSYDFDVDEQGTACATVSLEVAHRASNLSLES